MAVWLVRAGRFGAYDALALERGYAVLGWEELPDLRQVKTRAELEDLCRKTYPEAKANTIYNWVGQLWAFFDRIQIGDLIVLPLKSRSAIAIGRATGSYEFHADFPSGARHTRTVEWLRTDLPRAAFDQDLLFSLGAFMTVCRIQRNDAENRIGALLNGRPLKSGVPKSEIEPTPNSEIQPPPNLEEYARDQIRAHIGQKFRSHDLSRLVTAVLRAQGYQTEMSPQGPDGGVDIVAGRGPMGFDPPRLCVQVKSSDGPVDVKVLRELNGVMKDFGADQGLLVSWGGFKQSVFNDARRRFFEIRLWDADDLIQALLEDYEHLPADLQAELPLKRVWTLVLEE